MSEWKKVKLEEVCKIKSGKRLPKGHDFSSMPTEYKYIRARDIKNGIINGYNLVYITKDTHEKISQYIVDTNDIVITIVGASVGDVAYVTSQFQGMNLTENAVRLTDFSSYVDSKYAFYVLNSSEYYDIMQRIAGGAAQPKLGIYKIEAIELSLPPLSTQHRIATILSRYDALIENYQKQIKLLEEAAQRLYKEWFVDLRFPGHENTHIVDGVPEGWEKKSVTDLLEIRYGKDHKKLKDGTIPVYGTGGIMRYVEKELYSGESVLIPRKGSLNNILLVNDTFWTIDTMFYSVPRLKNVAKIVYHYLKGNDMYSFNIGAAVPSMTVNILGGMKLSLPEESVRELFENNIDRYYHQIKVLSTQLRLLTEARDRLLPKLMSGEITV